MKRVDFKHLKVVVDFEGTEVSTDITKFLGNLMMFNGNVIMDIGFEDLAKTIYYSEGEIDIPLEYSLVIKLLILSSDVKACVKRAVIKLLS